MSVLRLLPVLVLSVLAVGPAPSVRGPADAAIECAGKPEGPLMVRLASSGDPAGARRPVEVELQPVLELHDLAWRWELSPGVQLLAGDAQGEAAAARGPLTRLAAELSAPAGQGRARLLASARFTGHDADGAPSGEQVTVVRTLEWGEPALDAPRVLTADPDGGGLAEVVAPPVAASTRVRVGLLVSDSLGAQAPAAEVQLTVVPAAGPCSGAAAVASGGSAKPGAFGPPSLAALNLPVLPSGDFALHATG